MGGSLLSRIGARIDGRESDICLDETLRRLAALPNVTLLPRTTAFGYYPHNWIGLAEKLTDHPAVTPAGKPRERLWQVRTKQVVLAAGAIERPPVFAVHDRPGILLADAARPSPPPLCVAGGRPRQEP